MTNINWDLAPEGAVAIKQDEGKWKNVTWINASGCWWDDNDATWNNSYDGAEWAQTIATRPQARKTVEDVDAKSEPEWTHVTNSGCNCKVIVRDPDVKGVIIVLAENGEYMRHSADRLQPIKPTITRLESEVIFDFADSIGQLQVAEQWVDNNYTITD